MRPSLIIATRGGAMRRPASSLLIALAWRAIEHALLLVAATTMALACLVLGVDYRTTRPGEAVLRAAGARARKKRELARELSMR